MKLYKAVRVLSAAVLLAFAVNIVSAQAPENADRQRRNRDGGQNGDQQGGNGGGRNSDPAEIQKFILERTKVTLEITDDTVWTAIEPLVTKVGEARMAVGFGRGRGGRGGQGGQGGGGFPGMANPDADTLQKVIDAKSSNAETKAALSKFVEARKAKQAALEKAQADLRKVLTPRQEAIATVNGLL